MSLNFGRAPGNAEVTIDHDLCSDCGICVEICKGGPLIMLEGHLAVTHGVMFDCIACGACVAFCPMDAIRVSGRDLFPEDVLDLPSTTRITDHDSLQSLLLRRRSIRDYEEREVESSIVQKVLDSASTAPMGLPPSEVGVVVFSDRKAVVEAKKALLEQMRKWKWMFSPFSLALMRPFVSRNTFSMYHDFVVPAIKVFDKMDLQGADWFLYGAPLAFYFYGSAASDPADPLIAADHAMMAAESLGLGTCMLGFPGYLFLYSNALKKKYGLPGKVQPGIMLICGYPRYTAQRAIRRRFARVQIING